MSDRRQVTIVGAGATGATCAEVLAQRDYAEIVLIDIKEGLPQGKALDINQMAPILGFEATVRGTNDYAETAGSESACSSLQRRRASRMLRTGPAAASRSTTGLRGPVRARGNERWRRSSPMPQKPYTTRRVTPRRSR